jgi:acetyl esterase/lipase
MSEAVARIAAAMRARRGLPPADIETRRAGFDAQFGTVPMPPGATAEPFDLGDGLTGLAVAGEAPHGTLLWLHGGAFQIGSARAYKAFGGRLALASGARVLLLDYPLAPENRCPAALEATIAAAGRIDGPLVLGGDSCGGNLALAAAQAGARADGLWLISPYLDLTHTGASIAGRAERDPFIDTAGMPATAAAYADDPADPRASPLFGRLAGLPPLLVQVGSEEVLFDDAVRLADGVKAAGGHAILQEWRGMIHVWPLFPDIDEGHAAVAKGGAFVRGLLAGASPLD